jgi:TonB dependent receptor-like, beta-barrel/Carboxypeptidase regulatory-like domain/TonB-dependent Receptor Plug Domain
MYLCVAQVDLPSIFALFLVLGSAPVAQGEGRGRIEGQARDQTGSDLPGVTVDARATVGGIERTTATDDAGRFVVPALPPGQYRLTFRLPSFATSVRTVEVPAAGAVVVEVILRVALNADVLVTGRRTFRSLADLDEEVNGLLGVAEAGSVGVVTAKQIEERPVYRSGEVFEAVPGVVVSQHSGEGKANQYYVRGFNIDHGTDLATWVAGAPVNMPTHAHGQGYSDNNFLIPELVSGVQYQKGTYSAEEGDFSAAGAVNVNYLNVLDHPIAKIEGGEDRFGRVLVAASSTLGRGHLLYAAEAGHSDGPWDRPDDYRKWNGVLRFSQGDQRNGFSVTAMAYSGRWNSTDQVPERAVSSGLIDRFGNIDPTDAGRTHRYTVAAEWRESTRAGLTLVKLYGIDYGLDLFSDFTYFLDDPVHGDQFEQKDGRGILGGSLSQRFLSRCFGKDTESVAGFQGRFDHIPTLGLYHTEARDRLETIRQDRVSQGSGALFFQTSIQWTPKLRTVTGLRDDTYHFDVESDDVANSGTRRAALLSPKASVVLGPWRSTEVYANWGWGFHSNDARGAVQTRDPKTGEPVRPVDPIVRAKGAEVGVRTVAAGRFHGTLALWGLDIASELVFVGDAGTTEPSRPSRRLGIEWSSVYTPTTWLTLDADLAYSRARFRDVDPAGVRVPGAVEGVASAGVTADGGGPVSGSLRLRYFGPRPLIEDDSVRSRASATLNGRLAYRLTRRLSLGLETFNLTNAKVSDIDYFYTSRLPGEPEAGVEDVHSHPLEPFTVRASITASF